MQTAAEYRVTAPNGRTLAAFPTADAAEGHAEALVRDPHAPRDLATYGVGVIAALADGTTRFLHHITA